MRAWLTRNATPIALVALAAFVVIGLIELLDAVARSGPVAAGPEDAELEGLASVAGLIKVLVFLGLGALIARPLRRRLRGVVQ